MRGAEIDPRVVQFLQRTIEELTPALIDIATKEVAAMQDAGLGMLDGDYKFKKAQAGVRASVKSAGLKVGNSLINRAIEIAVGNLPRK